MNRQCYVKQVEVHRSDWSRGKMPDCSKNDEVYANVHNRYHAGLSPWLIVLPLLLLFETEGAKDFKY